jgi:acetyl-CoA C-acetyltransferase
VAHHAGVAVALGEGQSVEREITPTTMPDGRVVTADDGPRPGVTIEGVSGLNPVFRPNGTVTAGNCCPLNDGAAAVVVMSDTKAAELGLTRWPESSPPASPASPPRSWASV